MNGEINTKINTLPPFKHFIHSIGALPSSYLESMSYYETMLWLCNYLKETIIPTVNNTGNAVTELQNLYIQLQSYVNNYFNNLDVQEEINNKLDSMAQDGSLTLLIKNYVDPLIEEQNQNINNFKSSINSQIESQNTIISNIASGSPLKAENVSGMTDTSRIYVNTSNGYWYYYNGSEWVQGGIYQSTSDNAIINELTDLKVYSYSGIGDIDNEITYNIKQGKQYVINVSNTDLTYGTNSTSLCIQYYDYTTNAYKDLFRIRGNYGTNNIDYYLNLLENTDKLRIVCHSSNNTATLVVIVKSIEEFYITNFKNGQKVDKVKRNVEQDKEYYYKVSFNDYDSESTETIYSNNTKIFELYGSTDGTTESEKLGEIIRLRNISLKKDHFIKFTPSNNYDYLIIKSVLRCVKYQNLTVLDISDKSYYDLYQDNFKSITSVYDSSVANFNNIYEKPVVFTKKLPFIFGNIYKNGKETEETTSALKSDYFKLNYKKLKITINESLVRYKLAVYNENKEFVENTDFLTSINEFNINENYYYRLVFGYQEGIEETIDFDSPIENGLINLSYVNNELNVINLDVFNSRLFNTQNSIHTPHLYAHRGYQAEAPENSIPAFKLAGEYKFWGIETDLYATSDNVVVCMHDETIDRMTDGTGNIADMTYQELSQYHIDTGTNVDSYTQDELVIPTIDNYLSICRYYNLIPFIELKTDIVDLVIQKIKDYGMEKIAIISSFDWNIVTEVRAKSSIFIHWIMMDNTDTHVDDLADLGNGGRSFNYTDLNNVPPELNATMNNKGVAYCFRAADTVNAVKKQIELGLSYIPTNVVKPSEIN